MDESLYENPTVVDRKIYFQTLDPSVDWTVAPAVDVIFSTNVEANTQHPLDDTQIKELKVPNNLLVILMISIITWICCFV